MHTDIPLTPGHTNEGGPTLRVTPSKYPQTEGKVGKEWFLYLGGHEKSHGYESLCVLVSQALTAYPLASGASDKKILKADHLRCAETVGGDIKALLSSYSYLFK